MLFSLTPMLGHPFILLDRRTPFSHFFWLEVSPWNCHYYAVPWHRVRLGQSQETEKKKKSEIKKKEKKWGSSPTFFNPPGPLSLFFCKERGFSSELCLHCFVFVCDSLPLVESWEIKKEEDTHTHKKKVKAKKLIPILHCRFSFLTSNLLLLAIVRLSKSTGGCFL